MLKFAKAGTSQQQAIMDLLKLLMYDGFLRNNGLNSLQSIKEIAKILNLSNGFKFRVKADRIVSLCQSSKFFSGLNQNNFLDKI